MEENIVLCEDVLVEVIKIFEIEGIVNMLLEMVVECVFCLMSDLKCFWFDCEVLLYDVFCYLS